MNITDVADFDESSLTEMARAPKICAQCGLAMAANHWYQPGVGWRCKQSNLDAFAAKQAAIASSTTPAPAAPTSSPAPPAASVPVPAAPTAKAATAQPASLAPTAPPAAAEGTQNIPDLIRKWGGIKDTHIKTSRLREGGYTIHPDHSVTVKEGGVTCAGRSIKKVPFKFREVTGNFLFTGTNITSCENMPDRVIDGMFIINSNEITSFVGCPTQVDSDVMLGENPASSLEGIPRIIGGSLHLTGMKNMKSLQGIDEMVDEIDGHLYATQDGTTIESHVLGVLLIKKLQEVSFGIPGLEKIINKHLASEERDEFACQEELIAAGYSAYADL